MDMVRSMFKENNLPNEYWGEAANCGAYILNRYPTKSVMNKVPEKAWTVKNKFVTHMRVFGCVTYAHDMD